MARITVSAVPLMGDLLLPALMQAAAQMDGLCITFRASLAQVCLDEPNLIALRAGGDPTAPGVVGHWLGWLGVSLVTTPAYIERHGRPQRPADLAGHVLAAHEWRAVLPPWFRWLAQHIAEPNIGFFTDDEAAMRRAIRSGFCAGFLPVSSLIWSPELVELYPPQPEWRAPLWLAYGEGAGDDCRAVAAVLADVMSRSLAE